MLVPLPLARSSLRTRLRIFHSSTRCVIVPLVKDANDRTLVLFGNYLVGRRVGKGRFGYVYEATDRATGRGVAVKFVDGAIGAGDPDGSACFEVADDDCGIELARDEIDVMSWLPPHPNVVRMLEHFETNVDGETTVAIVLELADGDLYARMEESPGGRLDERAAAAYVRDVARALRHLHRHGITHRDVKPENVLLFSDSSGGRPTAKLCDFGWATCDRSSFVCGTLDYLPPEMITVDVYDHRVDLWSLGVLAYELVAGRPPFEHRSRAATKRAILRGRPHPFSDDVSLEVRDFVDRLLQVTPSRRATIDDVLAHAWLAPGP